jgi:hypothetical protein
MPFLRPTITRLMALIGLVAINSVVGRAVFFGPHFYLLFDSVIIIPVLQFAIWRAIRSRDRKCAFWIGFVVLGTIAWVSFIVGELSPRGQRFAPQGTLYINFGSSMYEAWNGYADAVFARLTPLLANCQFDPDGSGTFMFVAACALVWTVPQLAIALLGGHLFAGLYRWTPARSL